MIEEKETERLGDTRVFKSDFRLIAATHENLEKLVDEGRFRKDLFYRLQVIPITIPPLRERKEDIPILAHHLMGTLNNDLGTKITRLTPEVLRSFESYPWPGNVRELANILERILYSLDGGRIERHHLPIYLPDKTRGPSPPATASLKKIRESQEREILLQVLEHSKYNKKRPTWFWAFTARPYIKR